MRIAILVVLAILTFLAAAKAHGRQVRLEREHAGYFHVVFGGTNPPYVEQLWQRERVRFWPLTGGLFIAALITIVVFASTGRTLPFGAPWWAAILGAGVAAFVISFTVCGGWSWAALAREGGWREAGGFVSALWWSGVVVLASATVFAAARQT